MFSPASSLAVLPLSQSSRPWMRPLRVSPWHLLRRSPMICYSWFDDLSVSSRRWYDTNSVFSVPSLTRCSQVSIERVKEYSELEREPPEFVEPRPPASWPTTGRIECKDLVIRYSVCSRCQIGLTEVVVNKLFSFSLSCQMYFMVLHSRSTPEKG